MSNFQVERDSHGRLRAQISEDVTVAIQILPETDQRRIERGVQAFAVVDINTSLGPIRIRNIHIKYRESWRNPYQVQWFKHSVRGNKPRQGQHDFLDVAGPRDPETRKTYSRIILQLFEFIRQEAQAGKSFPAVADVE